MFLDLLSMIVVSLLYSIFGFNVNSNYIFQVLPTVIISCLLILSGHIPFFKKAIEFLYKKIQKVEYLDIILFIFSAFVLTLSITLAFNIENLKINLLLVLVLFLMFMLFIVLIKYKLNAVENEIFLKTLKANNDFYISMNDENRIFRHNLMAKLLSIKSVSNRKARVLIDDLLTEFNSSLDFSKHIKDIPYGLNGILYEKIYPYLDKLNIKIDNKINYDIFDNLKPRRYNVFVEKIIISLDNAIESSLKSADKLLMINLYEDKSSIIVEVKNSYSNNINIDHLGAKNYSTKGNNRGLGLFSAFRNKEAELSVKIINNTFICLIKAKKNKNI